MSAAAAYPPQCARKNCYLWVIPRQAKGAR